MIEHWTVIAPQTAGERVATCRSPMMSCPQSRAANKRAPVEKAWCVLGRLQRHGSASRVSSGARELAQRYRFSAEARLSGRELTGGT